MITVGLTARELCLAALEGDHLERHGAAQKVQALAALCDVYQALDAQRQPEVPDTEKMISLGADGTPVVSEMLAMEVGPLFGISPDSAGALLSSILDLRYRHPVLWQAVCDLTVEVWKARRIADQVTRSGLGLEAAQALDAVITPYLSKWPLSRVQYKLKNLIVKADEVLAGQRARKARQERFVRIRHDDDGISTVVARMATPDAILLDTALTRLASDAVLTGRTETIDELRSEALGDLAIAALEHPAPVEAANHRAAPAAAAGDGQPQPASPRRQPPRVAELVVHLDADTLRSGDGIIEIDRIGPLLLGQAHDLFRHCRIRVLPVIDLNDDPTTDGYQIPERIRRHITARDPVEVFPYSNRASKNCDLDHTRPYHRGLGRPAAQTRASNLGPLSRKVHRAKTLGAWTLTQPVPGEFYWTSSPRLRLHRYPRRHRPRIQEKCSQTRRKTDKEDVAKADSAASGLEGWRWLGDVRSS